VEEFLNSGQVDRIQQLIQKLRADGLVIHVNPLQEFCQPEGDRFGKAAIDTITELLEIADYPIIVKEVGQGMGPQSLRSLLKLPLEAIEFAAFGGTNFALVELLRSDEAPKEFFQPLAYVGHSAEDMLNSVNHLVDSEKDIKCRQLIISGGISSFLDGYYLIKKSTLPAIYGQASAFLRHARGEYDELQAYIKYQVEGLRLAEAYLRIREK
jgi:isopentenyl-diphosphate delta-isomerase